jgi:exodeoxyribonuclease VII large subunit
VIVARGGGSFEELMAFNQEAVVRAIQAMPVPVITALGHTSDRTLADLVADREARTPTAAAEIVVPRKADLKRQLDDRRQRLQRGGLSAMVGPQHQLQQRGQTLLRLATETTRRRRDRLSAAVGMLRQRDPREVLRQRERSLEECRRRLARAAAARAGQVSAGRQQAQQLRERLLGLTERGLRERQHTLHSRAARLTALAPEQTLARGYSICLDGSDGAIIREAAQTAAGKPIRVMLSRGQLAATVEEARP